MKLLVLILGLAYCAGCTTHVFAMRSYEVELSAADPRDEKLKIELVRVEPTGAVVIYSPELDEQITAEVGGSFQRRERKDDEKVYHSFGALMLVESDFKSQRAAFQSTNCGLEEYWGPFRIR